MSDEGYKGHRAGSKKGKLREIFDTKGRDTAVKAGERMGLTKGTVSSWLWAWGRDKKRATVGKLTPTAKKAMAKAKAQVKAESKPAKKKTKKPVKKAA